MNVKLLKVFAGAAGVAMAASWAGQAGAQTSEVKEKPALYTYVANWNFPRAQWPEVERASVANQKILDKAVADGTIVGYGDEVTLIHQADGTTHDDWWSAMSLAGVLKVLEQFSKAGGSSASVLDSATNHFDTVYESRFYNWHPGSWKDGYTYTASYRLKPDAPGSAVETMSKNLIVPLLEKLLADGTLHEYEVDTQAIHTEAPGSFLIVYVAKNAEGLDKVNAALDEALKADPLGGVAFQSMVDLAAHHDDLSLTSGSYK
jgi:hypothetical protein